ncbi:hypothetical protein D3C80_909060 [compost metagenome]
MHLADDGADAGCLAFQFLDIGVKLGLVVELELEQHRVVRIVLGQSGPCVLQVADASQRDAQFVVQAGNGLLVLAEEVEELAGTETVHGLGQRCNTDSQSAAGTGRFIQPADGGDQRVVERGHRLADSEGHGRTELVHLILLVLQGTHDRF